MNGGRVLNDLKNDLEGRLKGLGRTLTKFEINRIERLFQKYAKSICDNIDVRFPESFCKVLEAFSIFEVDLVPVSSSPTFNVYGTDEITCLAKHFFPDKNGEPIVSEWKDFKFEMVEIKEKLTSLRKQLAENKLKFKQTSSEWALEYIARAYREETDFSAIFELAIIALIAPITNALPELGASAVKRVKSCMRSTMKNDILNALLHISLNGPPANSKDADNLINRVVDLYVKEKHYKVPQIHSNITRGCSSSTQTEDISNNIIDVDEHSECVDDIVISECAEQFMITNFEYSVSDGSENESEDNESETE